MSTFGIMLRESIRRSPVPGEIPAGERGVWKKVDAASQRLFPPLWGQFLPGLHREDARLYAAGVALTRDLYLAEGAALTRRDRELVALAVSVDTGSPVGVLQHARLLGALGDRKLAGLVQRRAVLELEEPRVRALVQTALERRWASRFEENERADIATIVFATHYLDRVVGVVGPQAALVRSRLFLPPAFLLARMLGLTRRWRPGWALSSLYAVGDPTSHLHPKDAQAIEGWTSFPGGETRTMTARFVVGAIQSVAAELFDNEVLTAIRQHVAQWGGEAIPLVGTWTQAATRRVQKESNRRIAEFGLLVARCPERVSTRGLLDAVGGSDRRRLALVTYAACSAALRLTEVLTTSGRR
ncbi:MAG: hypothetical protein AAF602_05190 [Myxococcota bacterium]